MFILKMLLNINEMLYRKMTTKNITYLNLNFKIEYEYQIIHISQTFHESKKMLKKNRAATHRAENVLHIS